MEFDADRSTLTRGVPAAARRGGCPRWVFYAGHGIEMDGVHYVAPVDARAFGKPRRKRAA